MFDVEKFIDEVRRRPALYNPKHRQYLNREVKNTLWFEIGELMHDSWYEQPEEQKLTLARILRMKWRSLRDAFNKEWKLEGAERKKRKYIYFDQLLFLKHTKSCDDDDSSVDIETREVWPDSGDESEYSLYQLEDESVEKTDMSFSNVLSESAACQKIELENDKKGNKAFLMSLLPFMDKIPDHEIINTRLQLLQTLQCCTQEQIEPE